MPITQGALRKQRADARKQQINNSVKQLYKKAVAAMRRQPTAKLLTAAFRALDRAAKTHVIHANKASRFKSRLSKLLVKKKKK